MSYEAGFRGKEGPPDDFSGYRFELDHQWRIVDLNEAAQKRLAMGSEVIGKSYWELFPLSSGTYAREILEEALDKDVSTKFQAFCSDLDAWFQITASPTPAGLRLVAHDVEIGEPATSPDAPLSDEALSRIADEMRRMADQIIGQALEATTHGRPTDGETWTDQRLARIADAIYRDRRRRREHFPVHFAEPQWNILLDLFIQQIRGVRVSVTSACIAADVPSTTALRALQELTDRGLISREEDVSDKRRAWVALTPAGTESMRRYLRHCAVGALRG